jgi:hypothetical protein
MRKLSNLRSSQLILSVERRETVQFAAGWFRCLFWLRLQVDTGHIVGVGTSHNVQVEFPAETVREAERLADEIRDQADSAVFDQDINEALRLFPILVRTLADSLPVGQES